MASKILRSRVFIWSISQSTQHISARMGEEVIMSTTDSYFYYYDMIAGKVVKVPKIPGMWLSPPPIFSIVHPAFPLN